MNQVTDQNVSTHLLRVEGVNMDAYIFNTNDLGAMRGAGLSLLNAVKGLKRAVPGLSSAEEISLGASSGLYEVKTDHIDNLLRLVRNALQATVPHGTFVVDALPAPEAEADFRHAVEKLIALNRWRQAMACSLSLPKKNTDDREFAQPACALEGTRPGLTPHRVGNRDRHISTAIESQRDVGTGQAKPKFYNEITGLTVPGKFANSFEDIALYDQAAKQPLNNKMAVFYADGNSFGKIQRETCLTKDLQVAFDDKVRGQRESFLADFLGAYGKVSVYPAWFKGDAFRFETLLWGGDEFMFVMPAALGWEFARFFFEKFAGGIFEHKPLSYTASLVFCHHHAHIRRIKHLLKDGLAEEAKNVAKNKVKKEGGHEPHQLIVQALESYDNLGEDVGAGLRRRYGGLVDIPDRRHPREDAAPAPVGAGLRRRYGGLVDIPDLILKPHADKQLHQILGGIQSAVTALRAPGSDFARSQLRALIHRMLDNPAKADALAQLDGDEPRNAGYAFRNASDQLAVAKTYLDLFPKPTAAWLHLEELWDYAR